MGHVHRSWQSKCAERERLKRVAQKRKEARHARGLRPRGPPKKLPESSARKPPRGQPKEVSESAAPKRPRGRPVDPSSKRQRRLALQLEATQRSQEEEAEGYDSCESTYDSRWDLERGDEGYESTYDTRGELDSDDDQFEERSESLFACVPCRSARS